MKTWNVRVFRDGQALMLGQVAESNQELARCAALHRFGVSDDEVAAGEVRSGEAAIYPEDEFEVSPAL